MSTSVKLGVIIATKTQLVAILSDRLSAFATLDMVGPERIVQVGSILEAMLQIRSIQYEQSSFECSIIFSTSFILIARKSFS